MREIVDTTPEDWAEFRAIRLRALADDPDSFSMTLAGAVEQAESVWRERLDTDLPILLAREDGATVAMGGAWVPPDADDQMMVWGMWTAPEARRRGHGGALLDELLAWAGQHGRTTVELT